MAQDSLPVVFVVSDSIGETAELVTRAAAAQFDRGYVDIRRFISVETPAQVEGVIEEALHQPTLVVYTLILPELRQKMAEECARFGVPSVDIMGPMLDKLAGVLGQQPKLRAGLVRKLDEEYFQRMEAVEFAVKYDDGKDPRGCLKADVVLLGVSRSSKTPVSMYLAHRRVKAANIPLVPEVPIPNEVFAVSKKCVGLLVDPHQLLHIREERLRTIGLRSDANYANLERILDELTFAEQLYRRLGCPIIDVTNKAIEETAVRVLEIVHRRGATAGD